MHCFQKYTAHWKKSTIKSHIWETEIMCDELHNYSPLLLFETQYLGMMEIQMTNELRRFDFYASPKNQDLIEDSEGVFLKRYSITKSVPLVKSTNFCLGSKSKFSIRLLHNISSLSLHFEIQWPILWRKDRTLVYYAMSLVEWSVAYWP